MSNAVAKAVSAAVENQLTVRGLLETFVSGAVKVAEEQNKLQDKRQGTYSNGVRAAILAGNKETFEKEIQSFMDDIRQNKGGYARNLGCKVAKRQPKGQPKNRPVYVVPSAVSALKTYMIQALEYNVPLTESEGDNAGEPRAYSQIRTDVNNIKAEAAKKALTGDPKIRVHIGEMLDAIESRLEKIEGDALTELEGVVTTALETARKFSGMDAQRAAKKEQKAAKAADKPQGKKAKKKAAKKAKSRKADKAKETVTLAEAA